VVNPNAHLIGQRSEAHLFGAYFADATQHHEHRVYVNHVGSPDCFRGQLQGRTPRTRSPHCVGG
jgi:Fe-S cluster assembly protein SufD